MNSIGVERMLGFFRLGPNRKLFEGWGQEAMARVLHGIFYIISLHERSPAMMEA